MSDNANLEPLILDLVEIVVPVTIRGEEFELLEADGEVVKKYRNTLGKNSTFVDGGFAGAKGPLADAQYNLVASCLFPIIDECRSSQPVTIQRLCKWPNRVQEDLYTRLDEISDLGKGEEDLKTLKKQREKLDKQIAELEDEETVKND
jgi:hypothetical protein